MAKSKYLKIKQMAVKQGVEIYFGDADHIQSDHHVERTWDKKRETPTMESMDVRHGMSHISAVTSLRPHALHNQRKNGVNAKIYIEFSKLPTIGTKHPITSYRRSMSSASC